MNKLKGVMTLRACQSPYVQSLIQKGLLELWATVLFAAGDVTPFSCFSQPPCQVKKKSPETNMRVTSHQPTADPSGFVKAAHTVGIYSDSKLG